MGYGSLNTALERDGAGVSGRKGRGGERRELERKEKERGGEGEGKTFRSHKEKQQGNRWQKPVGSNTPTAIFNMSRTPPSFSCVHIYFQNSKNIQRDGQQVINSEDDPWLLFKKSHKSEEEVAKQKFPWQGRQSGVSLSSTQREEYEMARVSVCMKTWFSSRPRCAKSGEKEGGVRLHRPHRSNTGHLPAT